MPKFSWEPLDFLEALEVVPIGEEYGISYTYRVSRGSISLELIIWPFNGEVELFLNSDGSTEALVHIKLLECPGARVIRDKRRTSIEFSAAQLFGERYDHNDAPPFGFRLQIQPFIQITTFTYPV